ncbi:hypothetical protein FF098_012230 [Parvularcula flava]|uniref:Uncharacterized protein n=1 Tax=Aquisalinus luteolus TaxID=1566827 RepID=A0ABX0HQS0_9PROT|nr:hypothetical protein [Aquisalinus luteolus]NHK28678.1 hypothetical protein [Aquisalinus luteolus]
MTGLILTVIIFAAVMFLLFGPQKFSLMRRQHCSECGTILPFPRKPASFRQAMWGGWICPSCGTEVDGRGRKIEK